MTITYSNTQLSFLIETDGTEYTVVFLSTRLLAGKQFPLVFSGLNASFENKIVQTRCICTFLIDIAQDYEMFFGDSPKIVQECSKMQTLHFSNLCSQITHKLSPVKKFGFCGYVAICVQDTQILNILWIYE